MSFFDVINIYGLMFVIPLVVPHIVFVKTHKYNKSAFSNRAMLYISRIGRYCSIFLMFVNIGVLEEGFPSDLMKNYWIASSVVLIVVYIVLWLFFFKRESKILAYAIVFVTAVIIIQSGLLQIKTLLFISGIIYLIGDIYLTRHYFLSKD